MEEPNVVKMFKAIDVDNNGTIDFTEFATAASDKRDLLSDENLLRAFNILDRSGTGVITKRDFKQILDTNAEGA